jgi:formamidopyrimidine-DNA glycosylase
MNRKKGIKGLLLDQRAVVSGVGNWVADELLYRCRIHPDQTYLTIDEARSLVGELHRILSTAIARLDVDDDFPDDWLFHRRWRSGGGGNAMAKDINGRTITFIQSGGRSTAIVPSIQKKLARTSAPRSKKEDSATRRAKLEDDPDKKPGKKGKVKEERATSKPIPRMRKAKLEDAVGQNQKVTARSSASEKLVKKRKVKEEGVTSKPITQPTRMSGRLRRSR